MNRRTFLIFFLFLLTSSVVYSQENQNHEKPQKVKIWERSMIIKNMVVRDKSKDFVLVDGKEYKWFGSRQKAIEYFQNMEMKRDLITVYIDSNLPDPKELDIYTLTGEIK